MPYLRCSCGTLVYSVARWSSVDACPRCDSPIVRRSDDLLRQAASQLRQLRAVQPPHDARPPTAGDSDGAEL